MLPEPSPTPELTPTPEPPAAADWYRLAAGDEDEDALTLQVWDGASWQYVPDDSLPADLLDWLENEGATLARVEVAPTGEPDTDPEETSPARYLLYDDQDRLVAQTNPETGEWELASQVSALYPAYEIIDGQQMPRVFVQYAPPTPLALSSPAPLRQSGLSPIIGLRGELRVVR